MFANQYRDRRVFVTGHTGFKGSWLSEWLLQLGAKVTGFSDAVGADCDHFTALGLSGRMQHVIGDVRDLAALEAALRMSKPDFVFHLAAQSLVRLSYRDPVGTFTTNVIGTANLLDALRRLARPVACVVVTSDKCYENREVVHGYRDDDALGGHDPYSASKAAAEIVLQAFRRSFFGGSGIDVRLASARAGNVIGGGDWSQDRIVPDCVRSLIRGESIIVRNPGATRPWQHVLEPLSGYLWLGALLDGKVSLDRVPNASSVCSAFNFGPLSESNCSVGALVGEVLKHWPGSWQGDQVSAVVHEAGLLGLSIDKAFHVLNWHPVWSFSRSVEATVDWYRDISSGARDALVATHANINAYMDDARRQHVRWAEDQ